MARQGSYSALPGASSTTLPLPPRHSTTASAGQDSEDLSDVETGRVHSATEEEDYEEAEGDGEGRRGLLSGEKNEMSDLETEGVMLQDVGKGRRQWLDGVKVSSL